MAKFIPDIKTQRWIVIAPSRVDRPDEKKEPTQQKPHVCPFCSGNESMTPPEIIRIGEGEKDKIGWRIRVVPNLFPITDIHEVFIHSPDHDKDIESTQTSQVIELLTAYRSRFQANTQNGQVMIFHNHGELAGASLSHPHSQLVVIPNQINLDALIREPIMNIVEDNTFYVTYCPDFSQWPYEIWIASKKLGTTFAEIGDEEIRDLASVLKRSIQRLAILYEDAKLKKIHGEKTFAYNFYIHHAKDWFIRIIPRLVHRAGFELGTGLSVNIIDPAIAAGELRSVVIAT